MRLPWNLGSLGLIIKFAFTLILRTNGTDAFSYLLSSQIIPVKCNRNYS
jgi:hypothetical protein